MKFSKNQQLTDNGNMEKVEKLIPAKVASGKIMK